MVQKQTNSSEKQKKNAPIKKPSLNVGDLCDLKITALGANNIGIDEYSYASSVLVPFAKLGDTVKANIVKIQVCDTKKNTIKFAIAKIVSAGDLVSKSKIGDATNVQAGAKLAVSISSFSGSAIAVAELQKNYKIFIINSAPSSSWAPAAFSDGQLVDIEVTRVKAKYAFAKLINNVKNQSFFKPRATEIAKSVSEASRDWKYATNNILGEPTTFKNLALFNKAASFGNSKRSSPNEVTNPPVGTLQSEAPGAHLGESTTQEENVEHMHDAKSPFGSVNTDSSKTSSICLDTLVREGNKLTLVLPNTVKQYDCLPNYIVMKLSNTVLFIKLALGATLGNRVKIKLTKVLENTSLNKLALSLPNEIQLTEKSKAELASFETAADANSKNLIKIAIAKVIALNPISFTKKRIMVKSAVGQMLASGMHFGEKAVKCDARMKNYVWLRQKGQNKNKPLIKKGRNIINLLKTRRCLNKSLLQLSKYAAKGRTFLFVGTKKPAAALIARASLFSKTSFFVNTRWLGGMLTNWKTILKSIAKVRPILKEKQVVVKEILAKRQNLKNRLMSKAILLKKKSKMLLRKGLNVLKAVSNASTLEQNKLLFKEKNQKLTLRTQQLVKKSGVLLQTRQQLLSKRNQLTNQSFIIKQNVNLITNKYKVLINQVTLNRKKLIELKSLFVIAKQIQKVKTSSLSDDTNLLTLCYAQFKRFNSNSMVIPNPPSTILNKIVLTIREATSKEATAEAKGITQKSDKIVLISGLLSKFSMFIPHVRECIKVVCANIVHATEKIKIIKQTLATIKQKVHLYANLKTKINYQLQKIKTSILIERQTLNLVKRKMKQLSSEIRLLKFLPKLRYLSTPYSPMYNTVKVLMKTIVDPKLKYPMNLIYDQKLSLKSKKVVAARKKTWQRLEKYFGGIANMTKMKSNKISKNVAILVGQKEEQNAVRECKKLGIKMFSIVDTNCNPRLADHFVVANDDSRNSIKYILAKFLTRIRLAQKLSLNVKKLARLTK